ncbi:unnamed protein product [Diatraea saccharalis]|uniref:Uncharacterized protein n=1 Tax=Diatraea saccharalis TaxID=40085 RepID=A0A9N9WIK0_9NEOP|nr:unnamed protein product [Diatraea saccharalis]
MEVEAMKTRVQNLEKAAMYILVFHVYKRNLIIHGILEKKKNNSDIECTLETLNKQSEATDMETWDKWELNKFCRTRNKSTCPILISVTLGWSHDIVLKNNKKFTKRYMPQKIFPKKL